MKVADNKTARNGDCLFADLNLPPGLPALRPWYTNKLMDCVRNYQQFQGRISIPKKAADTVRTVSVAPTASRTHAIPINSGGGRRNRTRLYSMLADSPEKKEQIRRKNCGLIKERECPKVCPPT